MNLIKKDGGYSFISDNVSFDFLCAPLPSANGRLYEIEINGRIPTPIIKKGDRLLLPVDEGIAVTADREYEDGEFGCNDIRGKFCSREGTLSMVIVERDGKFLLIALSDGKYGSYSAKRTDGLYGLEITTKRSAKVSYGIFDTLPDACKCYRKIKGEAYISLSEKCNKNPNIKKLIGGAIFWLWNDCYDEVMYSDKNTDKSAAVGIALIEAAERMHRAGIDNALFGIFFCEDSEYVEELYKKYGYLSTQYDNYSDVLNPALLDIIPNNRVKACDYTRRRMKDYPDGVIVEPDGALAKAWALKGFDGKFHSQNQLCPEVARRRIMEEIPRILSEYPCYAGRFIDVFGGGYEECHSDAHPLTMDECKKVKKAAFSFLSDIGLIVGTEDGFEEIIDDIVYTEGLHSPVYFRNIDSGRNHAHTYESQRAEHIKKHMLDPSCRVPLWHLVYHDSIVAFPYWGDSTASSRELLKQKILYACLYGCAPLYSCFIKDFNELFEDILSSYKRISAVHKRVATLNMTDFEILSDDYKLQRSVFGDKYEVVANFSDEERFYNGCKVGANDFLFEEIK